MKYLFLLLSCVLIFSISCSKKSDKDKIAEAQNCLDSTKGADSLSCMSIVDGVNSSAAELIRCAAYLQWGNIGDPSTIASVINTVTGSTGSNTAALLPLVVLNVGSNSFAESGTMFNYCLNSESKGLLFLSAFSRIATAATYAQSNCGGNNAAYSVACSSNTTCEQMLCAVNNTSTLSALGDVLIATNNLICKSDPTQSICSDITYSVNNAPTATGAGIFCTYVARVSGLTYAVVKATTGGSSCP
jgi:hypothetical protein